MARGPDVGHISTPEHPVRFSQHAGRSPGLRITALRPAVCPPSRSNAPVVLAALSVHGRGGGCASPGSPAAHSLFTWQGQAPACKAVALDRADLSSGTGTEAQVRRGMAQVQAAPVLQISNGRASAQVLCRTFWVELKIRRLISRAIILSAPQRFRQADGPAPGAACERRSGRYRSQPCGRCSWRGRSCSNCCPHVQPPPATRDRPLAVLRAAASAQRTRGRVIVGQGSLLSAGFAKPSVALIRSKAHPQNQIRHQTRLWLSLIHACHLRRFAPGLGARGKGPPIPSQDACRVASIHPTCRFDIARTWPILSSECQIAQILP